MLDRQKRSGLEQAIRARPRFPLADVPTPLEDAPRLSDRLKLRVLVKRDDLTGLAMGGNKVRKLEFLVADALERGADTIVTTGGSQSNHARITAAACRRAGLSCFLVLDRGEHPEQQGNLLLDELLGADVQFVDSQDPAVAQSAMEKLADDLQREGRNPYVIPRGGSVPVGATGYAAFALELLDQLERANLSATHLYLGTGSTGTHSGTLAGVTAAGSDLRVEGISVSRDRTQQVAKVASLTKMTLEHLGLPTSLDPASIHVDDTYRGPGYGVATPDTMTAIKIAAADEALILDPVYTGKAFAGLLGHVRTGVIGEQDTVIFLHSGGGPALFAYHREIVDALAR